MKILLLLFVGTLVLSCSGESKTQYSTDLPKPFLIITENTTREELTKIAAEFKRTNNITIDFSETVFFENGKIERLMLTVDCHDGHRGTASSTSKILKTKKSGFARDYTPGAKAPFTIGAM